MKQILIRVTVPDDFDKEFFDCIYFAPNTDGEFECDYEILDPAQPIEQEAADKARMDYLETMTVNVRKPLVYGSENLFWSSPNDCEGLSFPSNIRARIDSYIAATPKEGAGDE
jgi:hypothetical protein